ncbi:hypothetical protein CMV_026003 [Castanea mollissima]|uniref:Uncharacterized protein n=1 Tax=Castanea mollissima TaxID=60419 RepID=A0A8J4Q8I5_9ROSI|nr:hypothetical protein CMV_026003 [Castanea mollissima]
MDRNSQIFFSVCTCPLCIADSTSEDLKSKRKGGILIKRHVFHRHMIMIRQEAMVGYHCNENLLCAIGYDL